MMKILAILPSSPAFSYGQFLEGLTIKLGEENVWVYFGGDMEGFFTPTLEQVLDNANTFDAVLYAYHQECHQWVKQVRDIYSGSTLVLVDNSDLWTISDTGDFKPDIVLKQEMLIHYDYPDNYYPVPLSVTKHLEDEMPANSKDPELINVTWVCTSNFRWEYYGRVIRWAALRGKKVLGTLEGAGMPRIPRDQHLDNLSRCGISIAPSSMAMGCGMLFWESVLSGCCCFTNNYRVRLVHPFKHLKHVIYFYSDCDIFDTLDKYCDIELQKAIGEQSREHVLKYHTSERRAEYVLDVLSGNATVPQL